MKAFDRYSHEGKIHKQAIWSISQDPGISSEEKALLLSSYQHGKWLSIGLQFPVIWMGIWIFNRKVSKLPTDKKVISFVFGSMFYLYFFKLTTAYSWHQAFSKCEPTIKDYIKRYSGPKTSNTNPIPNQSQK
jgi:hypothetical protein